MCNTTDSSLKTYNLNDIHLSLKMKMTLSIFFFKFRGGKNFGVCQLSSVR
jgi:hypothetical protein